MTAVCCQRDWLAGWLSWLAGLAELPALPGLAGLVRLTGRLAEKESSPPKKKKNWKS